MSAGRRRAGANEIDLSADGAEIATAGDLGVGLSGQVDLDRRVDGMEFGQRAK